MLKTIRVKLTPSAKKTEIVGWADDENGECYLKVSVTAVPEKGKANKALITLLAKHFKIPKSSISIVRGGTERLKTLELPADCNVEI